jgi:hypothetical protein
MTEASIVERFAENHPWLVRVALVAACGAMIATSAPPRYNVAFEQTVEGHRAELTAENPSASFEVRLRATDLGPRGEITTLAPTARAVGTIDRTLAPGVGPAIDVDASGSKMSAFTSFVVGPSVSFDGSCSSPPGDPPCEATFQLELTRDDGGMLGGTIVVDWSLELHSSAPRNEDDPAGPFALPWTVEITP